MSDEPSAHDIRDRFLADMSTDICKARNEYDDEHDGDIDDYMAARVLVALENGGAHVVCPHVRERDAARSEVAALRVQLAAERERVLREVAEMLMVDVRRLNARVAACNRLRSHEMARELEADADMLVRYADRIRVLASPTERAEGAPTKCPHGQLLALSCKPCAKDAAVRRAVAASASPTVEPEGAVCGWPSGAFMQPCQRPIGHPLPHHPFAECHGMLAKGYCTLEPGHVGDCGTGKQPNATKASPGTPRTNGDET